MARAGEWAGQGSMRERVAAENSISAIPPPSALAPRGNAMGEVGMGSRGRWSDHGIWMVGGYWNLPLKPADWDSLERMELFSRLYLRCATNKPGEWLRV
jgi:hypothetical protein